MTKVRIEGRISTVVWAAIPMQTQLHFNIGSDRFCRTTERAVKGTNISIGRGVTRRKRCHHAVKVGNWMMLALKSWIAAAALGLGVMVFSAPTEARGFGGFRGGISGFHGGGIMRGFGHFRNPAVVMHPGSFRSPFLNRRGFVSRPFFFRRRFADDRRFFFRRHRFVGPFAIGFVGAPYSASAYDSAYATPPDDQGVTQTSPSYDDPHYVGGAYGDHCSLLIRLENSGGHLVVSRTPLCNNANVRTVNTNP
jgi:hypothetical protein